MTKYYVRTIPNPPLAPVLTYTTNVKWVTVEDFIKRDTDNIFSVCEIIGTPPDNFNDSPRGRTTDIHLSLVTQTPEIIIGVKSLSYLTAARWVTAGWSSPSTSYSTYLSELCAFFESAKVTDASIYGTDNGEINLYVFSFSSNFFPIFMKGNDSHYDQIIEI